MALLTTLAFLAGHRSLIMVDTNEQAAQVSAQLRAELVRLAAAAPEIPPALVAQRIARCVLRVGRSGARGRG